jgi:hypothetical protein
LPPTQPNAAVDYGSTVAALWTGLSRTYPSFDADGCARALAGYLAQQPWAATGEQALGVSELVKRLYYFDPGRRLAKIVASTLAATPDVHSWDFAQEWLAWGAAIEPEAVRGRLLESLAAPPSTDPDYLARVCVSACREGIDPDLALLQVGKSGALTNASQAYNLFNALQQRFAEAGMDDDAAMAWQLSFIELAASGKFGAGFQPELRAMFSDEARREIRFCIRLLAAFAEDGRERQYEWTEAEHKELTAIADEIESMLKKARKFPLPRKRRLPFGGGPEGDAAGQAPNGTPADLEATATMPGAPE